MQSMRLVGERTRVLAVLCGPLLLVACGGGAASAPPAAPPVVDIPAEPEPAEVVPTEPEPPEEPSAPRPFVFGVDLDTVQAGPFDQGKMWTFEAPPVAVRKPQRNQGACRINQDKCRIGAR